eukprot:14802120-Alexandrium_andersonii.AAC.1
MAHGCIVHLCSWRTPTGGTPHPTDGCAGACGEGRTNSLVHWCSWRTPHPADGCTGARGASRTQRLLRWCPWRAPHPPDGCT